jgi:acyl dehydratase
MPTKLEQAALYRLSGDYNPLHIDPDLARSVGFERPILHGLCSYAVAGRAILRTLCDDQPERLKQLDVRFSTPVYPGETLLVEIWRLGAGEAAFRCTIVERGVVAINNGVARFDPD